jgi:two-component system NarL family response regulator
MSSSVLRILLVEAGVQGYCLKGIAAETLILALRSIAAGASWWDQTATTEIRATFGSATANLSQASTTANPLTRREQEILTLMAAGQSNQEIAQALYITPGTVRVHVHTILQKLDVRDRTQAVVMALQNQLILKE